MRRILALLLAFAALQAHSQYTLTSQQQYLLSEIKDAQFGQVYYAYNYPKAYTIYNQLKNYTGMDYPVLFVQTFNWGQAHNGGLIFIDYSSLNKNVNILAFVLAHEWGHEALGHEANIYHPNGSGWQCSSDKEKEDEADDYAGKFMAKYGYNLDVVYSYLRNLPDMGDDTHSTGPERAETIRSAYQSVSGGGGGNTSGGGGSRQRVVPCTHPAHPYGDFSPCTHAMHPYGDVYPCTHTCSGPYGYYKCHPNGDVAPCRHPAHPNGDASPCVHPLHPNGDVVTD